MFVSNVLADFTTCRIGYHREFEIQWAGKKLEDHDLSLDLRDVSKIYVMSVADLLTQMSSDSSVVTRTDPDLYAIKLIYKENGKSVFRSFVLEDQDTAARVAKALTHAVELCGGGEEEEPF